MKREPERAVLDRRVHRTRRQLRDALVALILDRGWERVSVQDVCARANVGRSTFYVHFADKEELLLSGFDELHASLDALRRSGEGPFGFVEPLLDHAQDNTRLFRALVGRKSGQHVLGRFRDVVLRLVEADLAGFGVEPTRRASVARYVAGGFLELLTAWLERPSSIDPHVLATTFRQLTRGALSSVSTTDTRGVSSAR